MILIVAVDKNWGIGKNNKLLYSLPEDMAFFRSQTLGKTIVMGRKTLESFKDAKPLPKRQNIVLTRKPLVTSYDNLQFINSLDEINIKDDNIVLIGGASLYAQFYNKCSHAYITKIKSDIVTPDVYFPNLDKEENWEVEETLQSGTSQNGIDYEILLYKNKATEV